MKAHELPTQAQLKEILHYDPETGVFRWRFARSNLKPWSLAGSSSTHGYWRVRINNREYFAHRLAWVYMTGKQPLNEIDHINRIRSDNKFVNLREATRKQNMENQSLMKSNTSGSRGASWDKNLKKWKSQIMHNKKYIYLGIFDTVEEAAKAASTKRSELFTHDVGKDKANKLI